MSIKNNNSRSIWLMMNIKFDIGSDRLDIGRRANFSFNYLLYLNWMENWIEKKRFKILYPGSGFRDTLPAKKKRKRFPNFWSRSGMYKMFLLKKCFLKQKFYPIFFFELTRFKDLNGRLTIDSIFSVGKFSL